MKRCVKWPVGGAAAVGGLLLAKEAWMRLMSRRCAKWEARQHWLESGVRGGCEGFTMDGGTRGTVLLVHGFGDSPSVWGEFAPLLARAGYLVRAMRLPGFCERFSARACVRGRDWTSAVRGELAALRDAPRPLWGAGHSLGSAVLLRTILEHRPEADGVGLFAPLFEVSRRRSVLLSPRKWFDLARGHVSILESPFTDDVHRRPACHRPPIERFIPAATYTALFETTDAILPRAEELTLPLWTAVSPSDQVADPVAAEAWHRRASASPRRRLVRAKASGHVLPLDHDAPALAMSLLEFIEAG